MKTNINLLSRISFSSGLALALAFAAWLPNAARAAEHEGDMSGMNMNHIKTQAEAEALKPGDSMSMTCTKCKSVMVQKVGTDKAHIKMMTIGEKVMCHACDGMVEVVGTGIGKGKNEEVKHVCSKCGDDAMFCSATNPGSGAKKYRSRASAGPHRLRRPRRGWRDRLQTGELTANKTELRNETQSTT